MKLAKQVMALVKSNPSLGKLLIPAVRKAYFDPSNISKVIPKGPLVRDPQDMYLEDEWSNQETQELRDRQEKGDLSNGKGNPEPMKYANDNEKSLFQATVKLAYDNKELRPFLLPLIKEAKEAEEEEEEVEEKVEASKKKAGKIPPQFLENVKKKQEEAKDKDDEDKEDKKASELYKATVKLAYENKELRPHLLPLLNDLKKKRN